MLASIVIGHMNFTLINVCDNIIGHAQINDDQCMLASIVIRRYAMLFNDDQDITRDTTK